MTRQFITVDYEATLQQTVTLDVGFGPQTDDGAKAWDTFQTLTGTAKKLGVSISLHPGSCLAGLQIAQLGRSDH